MKKKQKSKELRVIIAGGREFKDFEKLCSVCDNIIGAQKKYFDEITIVSGNAIGTDRLGEEYARLRGYNLKVIPADWFKLGRKAGIIRNEQMADYSVSDGASGFVIAFWNGKSRGTENMIDTALAKGNIDIYTEMVQY